jgi:hypothetical protein
VHGGWDGSGIYNEYGSFTSQGGNIDAEPQFVDVPDGDLHLQDTSPAIDAGDNGAVPTGVVTDLDGYPRFVDVPTVVDTGKGTPPIVDMGAYEVQTGPYLVMSKSVMPGASIVRQGTITYTVVLDNVGAFADTMVLFTDTLPSNGAFGGWIEQPSGAALGDDIITWSGAMGVDAAIAFVYSVDYARGDQGEVLTNTAEFSGTFQAGREQACFVAAVSRAFLPLAILDYE